MLRLLGIRTSRRRAADILSTTFSLGVVGAFAAFAGLWYYGRDLPDYNTLAQYEPPIVSRVYAANGALIGEFASERRIHVPYSAIPKRVVHAFIAAEDQRFFAHPGVDAVGVVRALRAHLLGGDRLGGASTITQQVAKNFFLSAERSYERKLREIILALRIERAFTKERILELYLNQIYLGRQSYGVAAAAQTYFGKALGELTVAEAAFLAALPQAPSRLDPRRNSRGAKARRNYVIDRMAADGYLTRAEAEEAKAAPLGIKGERPYLSHGSEYFVEEVRRELISKYGEDRMRAGGFVVRATVDPRLQALADKALRDGLVAYDRRHGWRGPVANLKDKDGEDWSRSWRRKLAAIAAPAGHGHWPLAVVLEVDAAGADIGLVDGRRGRIPLRELTWARKQGSVPVEPGKPAFFTAVGPPIRNATDVLRQGDIVLVEKIDSKDSKESKEEDGAEIYTLRQIPEVTGALVAMDPHTGRVLALSGGFSFWMSQFNNATQAWRQPGSSFKPYVYLAALEAGYIPTTVILDAPIIIPIPGGIYKPRNAGGRFMGPMTMRSALVQSRNLVTVRLATATGLDKISETAVRLGVMDATTPVISMALGAIETTPLRQVTAYSMIANGGKRIVPTLVDRIQDRYGRTIFRHGEACSGCVGVVFDGHSAPSREDRREQVIDPAHAYQITSMLQDAVRRGTGIAVSALGRPVAGKTGTTNDAMDAWFVGYTPDLAAAVWIGHDKPRTLGPNEQGGVTAAPVFLEFMRAALAGMPVRDFPRPDTIVEVRLGGTSEYYKKGYEPGSVKVRHLYGEATADAQPGYAPGVGNGMSHVY